MFLLILSFVLTLSEVESLAVKKSSEVEIAQEEFKSTEDIYKSKIFAFVPSLEITGYFPQIDYWYDEALYLGSPTPVEYWYKWMERVFKAELSMDIPFGGEASVIYSVLKKDETSDLYQDREFYRGDLIFQISQPILGTSSSWDEIKSLNRAVDIKKGKIELAKRKISREVRENYVSLFILDRTLSGIKEFGELAEKGMKELDFLRNNGVIDEKEYLLSKGKLGNLLLKKMETEEEMLEARENLEFLTGVDSFDLVEPSVPEVKGEPVPDIKFQLEETEYEIEGVKEEISQKKRKFIPYLNISGNYGLKGMNGEISAVTDLSRSSWGFSVGITVPIFNAPSYAELSSLYHNEKALTEQKKAFEKELEMEQKHLIHKEDRLKRKIVLAEGTYSASGRALKEISPELLSLKERLDLLEDYIEAMKAYQSALKELLVLDVNFEKRSE